MFKKSLKDFAISHKIINFTQILKIKIVNFISPYENYSLF